MSVAVPSVPDRGRLSERPFAALLHAARERKATGVLRIQSQGKTSRVYFRGGAPAGAQVTVGYKPLGQVLVQLGLVDLDILDRALPAAEGGKPIGTVLVEMGALTSADLARAVELQQLGHLRALAALRDGTFEFEELQTLPSWTDEIRVTPERALLGAMAAPPAQPMVDELLAGVGGNLVRLAKQSAELSPQLGLDLAEQ
ncbi:MAG: DUF4388 domain-containing protein, partial [Myxococcales bacterium]